VGCENMEWLETVLVLAVLNRLRYLSVSVFICGQFSLQFDHFPCHRTLTGEMIHHRILVKRQRIS
jgi:hypothetical protein